MNALTTFSSPNGSALRILTREGEPWFIAKDVCAALALTNPTEALRTIPAACKAQESLGLRGSAPWLVNESGFYKLVLKSRKPEARKFQDWVTGDVLPSLRKHGVAMTAPVAQAVAAGEMSGAELMARAVLAAQDTIKKLEGERDKAAGEVLKYSARAVCGKSGRKH